MKKENKILRRNKVKRAIPFEWKSKLSGAFIERAINEDREKKLRRLLRDGLNP